MCGDIHTTYYLRGIDDIVTEESSLDFCQYYSISEKWAPGLGLKGTFEALAGNNCKITIIDPDFNASGFNSAEKIS